jgi:hypothetical protein
MTSRQAIFLFLALTTASWGYAASVANLSCTGNQGTVSINLSYFAVGATLTTPAANTGGVQNNVMPFSLHAALGSYSTLFRAVAAGVPFSSCTLDTMGSNGGAIQFTFNTVYVSSVTAVATSANSLSARTAYVDATLLFSGVAVTQAGNTIDDGGTSTPPGWDVGANKSS